MTSSSQSDLHPKTLNLIPYHPLSIYDKDLNPIREVPSHGSALIGKKEDPMAKSSGQGQKEKVRVTFPFQGLEPIELGISEKEREEDVLVTTLTNPKTNQPFDPDSVDTVIVSMPTGQFLRNNPHVRPNWKNVLGPCSDKGGGVRKNAKGELSTEFGSIVGTIDLDFYRKSDDCEEIVF